jgi:AcrR family transcriptional regulator
MMRDRVDLRVRRTQANLRDALIDLIEEKGFDAVTVGDIAERAMVTGIFEEAVNQIFREIGPLPENLEGLLSSWSELDAEAAQSYIDSQLAAWSTFFEHIARHARLYRVMLGKRGSSWFTVQMRDYFAEAIRRRARFLSASGLRATNDPHAAPAEFVIISLAHWLVGMLAWWIENGMIYSPQQMTLWFARFAMYGYPSVLGLNIPHTIGGVTPSDRPSKQS